MAQKLRAHWGRLIGASLLVLATAHLAPRWIEPPALAENRVLAERPAWPASLGELRAFRKAADAWVADRFPPRAHLIGALNALRLQFGVSGSPRVIVGRDGWLFYDDGTHLGAARGADPLTREAARAWLAALAGRTEALRARGAAYVVLIPPTKEVMVPDKLPGWYGGPNPDRHAPSLARLAQASGAGRVLYLEQALARPTRWGLATYSPHDTHWTGVGAYYGYAALMSELQRQGIGEGPRPIEAFAEVADAADQPGDLALMLGVASFVRTRAPALEDVSARPLWVVSYLTDRRDWTAPQVIDTGQPGKPVLLMTRDSFSNALVPFLYGDFSRIILTHNQEGPWREDLMARFQPDVVVTQVVETGVGPVMSPAPPASAEALARIEASLDAPRPTGAVPRLRKIEGTARDDRLTGAREADQMQGRPGNDTLRGLGGPDALRGGRGRDSLDGGDGDDWLSGGREDDVLRGGRGADTFNAGVDGGTDRVLDFSAAEGDVVRLDPGTAFTVRQEGADTVIEMAGARLILVGVQAAGLPAGVIARK